MFDFFLPLDKTPPLSGRKKLSLQKQLISRLQQAILQNQLPAGTVLVPSRRLAQELGVSRNTVVNAYEHLLAEGYVVTTPTGTRVAPRLDLTTFSIEPSPTTAYTPSTRLVEALNARQRLSANMLLAPGMPALNEFPLAAWRHCLERACHTLSLSALGTNSVLGEKRLRQALAQHLYLSRGVVCQAEQIIITEGAKQALELCVTLFTEVGDQVWIEDPSYPTAGSLFRAGNLTLRPFPVDREGISIPDDAWQNSPPTLIYTTPAHQYPSGAVLSITRRLSLLQKAQQHRCWIIEDDYDGEFRHQGNPIASMQGIFHEGPIIYIGSFSKTLFPTLRLGFMVLPTSVIRQVKTALDELCQSSHRLQQIALANFIENGEFGRHLARMRRLYRQRQQALREALQHYFPDHEIFGGKSGMHLTLRLPDHLDDIAIAAAANQCHIGVRAFSQYFQVPSNKQPGLVIGYGNTDTSIIPSTVKKLVTIIDSQQGKSC